MKNSFLLILSIVLICTQHNLLQTPRFQDPLVPQHQIFYTFFPQTVLHWRFNSNTTYVGENYPQPKVRGQNQYLYINKNNFFALQWYTVVQVRDTFLRLEVDYKMPFIQSNGTVQIILGVAQGRILLKYNRSLPSTLMLFTTCIAGLRRHNTYIQIRSQGFAENSTQVTRDGFRLFQFKVYQLTPDQKNRYKKQRKKKQNAKHYAAKIQEVKRKNQEQAAQGLLMLNNEQQPMAKQRKINQ